MVDCSRESAGIPLSSTDLLGCNRLGRHRVGVGTSWPKMDGTRTVAGSIAEGRIHVLELRAIYQALLAFQHLVRNMKVLMRLHNTTTVAYIRRQGGAVAGYSIQCLDGERSI